MDIIEIFKALGDMTRLRIYNIIRHNELCVCQIESILEITQSNASRHLNKLKYAGIITSRKDAQWVYYSLDREFIQKNGALIKYIDDKIGKISPFKDDTEKLKTRKSC